MRKRGHRRRHTGERLQIYNASSPNELDATFEAIARDHIPAWTFFLHCHPFN
jgi:hypothetical protein